MNTTVGRTDAGNAGTGTLVARSLVVCADDYGYADGVDQGILELVGMGRLSGFSCLVQSPRWPEAAARLRTAEGIDRVDIGLHINLTERLDDESWVRPLPALIRSAFLAPVMPGALPVERVRDSLRQQFDRFFAEFGRAPDHLDGHQHVHQLPVVRDLLLTLLDEYGWRPWVRSTTPPIMATGAVGNLSAGFKARVIATLGGRGLSRRRQRQGLAGNPAFGGVYGFDASEAHYLDLLSAWTRHAPEGGLLMCHPAVPAEEASMEDPIALARVREYRVLSGEAFGTLLRQERIQIVRGSACYATGRPGATA